MSWRKGVSISEPTAMISDFIGRDQGSKIRDAKASKEGGNAPEQGSLADMAIKGGR